MKFTTTALTLLSAGAVLATAAADNNNIKRHDRAPGFDEAHIPDGARGSGIKEHVINKEKRHDRAPGFDDAHIPANARSGLKSDHVMKKEAPLS